VRKLEKISRDSTDIPGVPAQILASVRDIFQQHFLSSLKIN